MNEQRTALAAHAVRLLLGGYYLVAGINWFVGVVPQQGIDSRWFLDALIASGLFALNKIAQIVFGACLVTNRFVPAAIACLMPITIMIGYVNIVLEHSAVFWAIGAAIIGANAFLLLMYSSYLMPLCTLRSRPSGASGLQSWNADWRNPAP